ncbi:MAG: DUF2089 domain-containing protein [Armatimonadota bacterium]|nr:DUF2089 domain-containing protein [bacterium]MCS7308813.1 DUF2089 domain-containing protein [Armatimonadota bacterium]MDW8103757.1 DUF2089 domain-containing protein [Armatimonadota bacterium]MDW8290586.1 DUF2089 domain-containing protein [Armatimonadota bacterium]
MYSVPVRCSICGGQLRVREVVCEGCSTQMRGDFSIATCRYCGLEPELQQFLEVFLRCRGVYNCVERELNISYPTVKARLEALLQALGLSAVGEEKAERMDVAERRKAILDALERGDMTAEEAAEALRQLQ